MNTLRDCYVCGEQVSELFEVPKNYFFLGSWNGKGEQAFYKFHPECFIEYAGIELHDEMRSLFLPPKKT